MSFQVNNQFNLDTISADTVTATNIYANNLTVNTSPGIGISINGYLPTSYYNAPFSATNQVYLLVDKNNNYIPLPNSTNCFLYRALVTIDNLGPGVGGAWSGGGTAWFQIGTSPLTNPTLALTIGGAQTSYPLGASIAPFNNQFVISGNAFAFAYGTDNYTGSVRNLRIGTGISTLSALQNVTTAASPNNYLAVVFGLTGAAITPGPNNAIGSLNAWINYFQF